MPTMIFYDKPIALNRYRHRDLKLDKPSNGRFEFARHTNSVLLAATELAEAGRDYPVVFVGKDSSEFTLAALVGLRDQENVFVDETGQWQVGRYLPAFVRRYPFVLAEGEDGSDLTVCVDESYSGLTKKKTGQALFDADGKETQVLRTAIDFLQLFHLEMHRTRAFAARLAKLELLLPKTVRIERAGKQEVLDGLFVVDEERLVKLPDAELLALIREGFMPWIYAHLLSLGNLERLAALQPALAAADSEAVA
ncbi:MAG: SapC family protein [Burkholderiaceae bacterium]|nr:SapC family protein [Burkholderiaceae bacterium]